MAVQVGRQIRIDEDILGYSDEQLQGLATLTRLLLRSLPFDPSLVLEGSERSRLQERLDMFEAEQQARRRLLEPLDAYDESYTGTCQGCGLYWDVRQHSYCPECGGYIG
jgi:hypothetical protein